MRDVPEEISARLREICDMPFADRVEYWSSFFIGRPYLDAPLDDDDMRLRFDGFDCTTFVETCIALALSERPDAVLGNLDAIRYRGGRPDFHLRNHFVSVDWIPANSAILRPLDEWADSVVEKEIDRGGFFEGLKRPFPEGLPLKKKEMAEVRFVSKKRAKEVAGRLSDCTVALFVGGVEWTVFSHMGLLLRVDGKLMLRHASSKRKMVVEEAFGDYVESRRGLRGVCFAALDAPKSF